MALIRWLHISDLHLGSEGAETNMMRDELLPYLKGMRLSWDYVFCTGDIRTANTAPKDFTDEMAAYLKGACDAVDVPMEKLFIVPGNHDVDKDVVGRDDAIKRMMFEGKGYYFQGDGNIKQEDMDAIMAGEADFKAFLGKFYDDERLKKYGNPQAPHFNIETNHFNILHVDTTVSYTNNQERNDLIVGAKFLYDAVRKLNRQKPTILLTHYPYTALHQGEKRVVSTMLQRNGVRLWLAGHEHEQVLQKVHYIYSLQAGELRKEPVVMASFLIGEYDEETGKCYITAHSWFREGWGKYPYVDLDNTPQDVFTCELKPKQSTNPPPTAKEIEPIVTRLTIEGVQIVASNEETLPQASQNAHVIERKELLNSCIKALEEGKILIVHGSLKIGKSTLAKQLQQIKPLVSIYENVLSLELEDKVETLLQANKGGQSVVVSQQGLLNLNFTTLDASKICQVEVPLLSLEETKELIATYKPEVDVSHFIWGHSNGHPVLVRTLCGYLSCHNWHIDVVNFGKVLNYTFDYNLQRTLADLMRAIITDSSDRELLNRLLLVNGAFTEGEVRMLAAINPVVDEPILRMNGMVPSWVIPEGDKFRVNSLFNKAWKPDVAPPAYKGCNLLLADEILKHRATLSEHDVLNYIIYAIRGGAEDEAGRMYITVLMNLHDQGGLPQKSILRGLWIDIPLPQGMSLEVKIGVRYMQLIMMQDLKKKQRAYLLNDLKQLVDSCDNKEQLSFYSSMVTMLCWMEGDVEGGLQHYQRYLEHKQEGDKMLKTVEDAISVFDTNIWIFLLYLKSVKEFEDWLDTFDADAIDYDHADRQICESCYLATERLWKHHLAGNSDEDKLSALSQIMARAEEKRCIELAIACIFAQMEILNAAARYGEARELYKTKITDYQGHSFAQLLLNGSMGNSYYRDQTVNHQEALPYFQKALACLDTELIPNLRLHIQEMKAFVLAETDLAAAIAELELALKYAEDEKHRTDLYEYYQCKAELSFAYWCVGNRVKAIEALSECVKFVIHDLQGGVQRFAKSFLCLCDALIMKYQCDVDGKPVQKDMMKPFHGMFTESDLTQYDSLYTEDRLYTSSYQMYQLSRDHGLKTLASEWAHKTIEECQRRGEVKEIHYLIFLLLPVFVGENDRGAIQYVIKQSCEAKRLSYQNHPELNKGNADFEFVEFCIVPVLMAALGQQLRGDDTGSHMIRQMLDEYQPLNESEMFDKVKAVFERGTYDSTLIAETNRLNANDYYAVYICAYLLTAFSSDASYAFSLLIAIMPVLEKQLIQILGEEVRSIVNRFIGDFWRAKILTAPGEFEGYQHLRDKGLPLIESYEGKPNQANHTMLVVSNHVKLTNGLTTEQERWMDE